MRIAHVAMLVASTFMLSGCATLFGGGTSQTVNLVPSDGKIHAVSIKSDDQPAYTINIPTAVPVKKSSKGITIFVKDSSDGELAPTFAESKMNPWFMANIAGGLIGGPLSSSIDCISGAAWRYDENVTVNTTKEAVAAAAAKKAEEEAKAKQNAENE